MTTEPMTTITMALFHRLQQDATDAQLRAEALRRELEAERAKTPDERLVECKDLLEAFKTITDHSVANLHPEFIRDLPAEALDTAAVSVGKVLGATQRDTERAGVWAERAGLIRAWRDKRKARAYEIPEGVKAKRAQASRKGKKKR